MAKKARQPGNEEPTFSRFKRAFLAFFGYKSKAPPVEIELAQEVQRNADEVLNQLRRIKKDLQNSVDKKLFIHVAEVVDPIASRIQSATKKLGVGKEEVQEFDQWINKKVKPLMEAFRTQGDDQKSIEKAVLRHAVEMCVRQIQTDLKVIKDDQYHKLRSLQGSSEDVVIYKAKMEEALAPVLQQWEHLCMPPKHLTLDSLSEWKSEVDLKRNKYFHIAMDIIDSIIPEPEVIEDQHEHMIINFQAIEDLEGTLPELFQMMKDQNISKADFDKVKKRYNDLEKEALRLEQDLRLTPELFERLKEVKQGLTTLHQIIQRKDQIRTA